MFSRNIKSVKKENGASEAAAILDRLAREDLSEEVTFKQVRKQTMQRSGGTAFQTGGRARSMLY